MKKTVLAVISIAMLSAAVPAPAMAGFGVINRACQSANRSAATPQLCSCIQKVANSSLNLTERRQVAKFFKDPTRAEDLRMSDRNKDEALWKRYKAFGEKAKASCKAY